MSVTTADFSGLCFGVEPPEPMARLLLPMARSKIGCMATAREPPGGAGECAGNYWDLFPALTLCLPTRPGAGQSGLRRRSSASVELVRLAALGSFRTYVGLLWYNFAAKRPNYLPTQLPSAASGRKTYLPTYLLYLK